MQWIFRARLARWAGLLLAGAVVLTLGALLVAWSGLYSVAASRGHWAAVEWILEFGMRSSVRTHALGIDAPNLDDPDLIRLGAGHFHSGCAYCHGAPGRPVSPVALHMLPPPPKLTKSAHHWSSQELFWIVKNGLKYTGMPAWTASDRDDEVWAVVAFLERLPSLDAQQYRALALGPLAPHAPSGQAIALAQATPDAVHACARCHGLENEAPASDLAPTLHGQRPEFLVNALRAYAKGVRHSGIMQPVASDLDEETIVQIADYYAQLPPPAPIEPEDRGLAEEGRAIALEGLLASSVPPCAVCHGADALPTYPRLAGQRAAYMVNQLGLWKRGLRTQTDADAIMAPIARRLSDRQIAAVSAYFASARPEPQGAAQR